MCAQKKKKGTRDPRHIHQTDGGQDAGPGLDGSDRTKCELHPDMDVGEFGATLGAGVANAFDI